ncbi:hypothetical protein IT401_02280 [Candidatus Nomurabacteria bacterium]|nr:hypothetical protein [Candidatus Nomurabacteria bacterium]
MSLFHSLLSQFHHRFNSQESNINTIIECINEAVGITLSSSSVRYQNNIVQLLVSPTIKMAILLKKETLLPLFLKKGIMVKTIQ